MFGNRSEIHGWRGNSIERRSRLARRKVLRSALVEKLEVRALLAAAPISGQFLVSETLALEESPASVAVIESTGDFVAVWTSFEEPGHDQSGVGIYARQFFADGTPRGERIPVNATLQEGDQVSPRVAVDESGAFVVVWQGPDEDGTGVFAQRYDANGISQDAAIRVNDHTTGDQQHPDVVMDGLGNAIITWQDLDDDGSGILARRYDTSGALSAAFQVNSVSVGNQTSPSIALARGTGSFVIVWEGEVTGDETSIEVFAQRYDDDATPLGGEIQVNGETARDQVQPHVATDLVGNFVVTWTSEGIAGSGSDVFARRFAETGMPLDGEFRVNGTILQGQRHSVVSMDADGDFMITWQSSHQDAFSWGIFGRSYDSNGDPLNTEFQVNSNAEQPQTNSALAGNTQGQVVAIWLGLDEDHASAVHAQRYQLPTPTLGFSSVGDEIILANYLGLEDAPASAAANANREFFVVWPSYGDDGSGLGIVGRRLDGFGNPAGSTFVINTTQAGNQTNPSVAMADGGESVVVWEAADQDGSGHGIYAQRFDALGNAVGDEFMVNTTVEGHQRQPSVAMNPDTGEFVVVWQSADDSLEGIYGQRYDAEGNPVGEEFAVNQQTYLDQVSPEVSMNAAGQFAVAWVSDHRSEFDLENDSEKSIFVQWYDADGIADGEERLVHEINKEYQAQEYPDLAIDADGNLTVVWQSITQDGSAWGVFGRQILADKTLVGSEEFQINQETTENQRRATVVADPAGNFTVSWQSDLQDQSATAIVSRQYSADGNPTTDEMIVNTWEMGPQILPVMGMTPQGDVGIFWSGQGLSRSEGIHGRIYEEGYVPPRPHIAVAPRGDQFLVSHAMGQEQSFPAVAVIEGTEAPAGDYVVAWTSFEQTDGDESGLGIYAQQFQQDGTPIREAFLVNAAYTDDDQTNPAVAVDAQGNFVVAWQSLGQDGDGFGIYAQRYDESGNPLGDLITVNVGTIGDQTHPAVAMDSEGRFLITWEGQSESDNGLEIFARRYDSDGEPLEENEFVVNETFEGNQSSATVAFSGIDERLVIGWQSEVPGEEGEVDVNIVAKLFDFNPAGEVQVFRDEFTVNTTIEHDQVGPHVAMSPSGEFVFAWTAEGQMGSGADVYSRRFDNAGNGIEDEFRVNDTTLQGQQYPGVGLDQSGNLIITWQSSHQDGFSWGVFAKVYDVDLTVVAEELQVNTNVQGPQINPVVSANAQGDAVVVWLGLDARHKPAVHAQRYELPTSEESAFLIGAEGEVVLGNYVALEEAPAAAGVDALGNYVLTWQSYGEDGSGLGVFARRFSESGIPLGDSFLVNTTTAGNQSQPDIAVDSSGGFVITWQSAQDEGQGYDVYAQRFDAEANPLGGEFRVNAVTDGHQGMPAVAVNPTIGDFVIVWQGPDADGLGIFGQRYDSSGNAFGSQFQVNALMALDQVSPTISMNADGQWVVAWVSDHRAAFDPVDTEKSIFVQWFDWNGEVDGDEVLVHSIQAEFEAQEHADVAIDPDGNFVIAWQSINQDGNTWGVFARQFNADKSPVQPIEFQVNQTVLAPQRHPSVAVDAEGNFVIAWQSHAQDVSGPGVFARFYDSIASPQTDEFLVPTSAQGPQTSPVVAIADIGEFGIFWTGHGTGRVEGAHGRVYGRESPDLQLTLTDGGIRVEPGGDIPYVITYANLGSIDATGVEITFSAPAGSTFKPSDSTLGWIWKGDQTFSLPVDSVAAGDPPQEVVFVVRAPLTVESGVSKLFATAWIVSHDSPGEEPSLQNNFAVESTPLIQKSHLPSLDVNRDGDVTALDALVVINYLAQQELSGGTLPLYPAADTNGDGMVTAADALLIINHLLPIAETQQMIDQNDEVMTSYAPSSLLESLDDEGWLDEFIALLAMEQVLG